MTFREEVEARFDGVAEVLDVKVKKSESHGVPCTSVAVFIADPVRDGGRLVCHWEFNNKLGIDKTAIVDLMAKQVERDMAEYERTGEISE